MSLGERDRDRRARGRVRRPRKAPRRAPPRRRPALRRTDRNRSRIGPGWASRSRQTPANRRRSHGIARPSGAPRPPILRGPRGNRAPRAAVFRCLAPRRGSERLCRPRRGSSRSRARPSPRSWSRARTLCGWSDRVYASGPSLRANARGTSCTIHRLQTASFPRLFALYIHRAHNGIHTLHGRGGNPPEKRCFAETVALGVTLIVTPWS